jgi:hypothetical protein
VILQVRQRQGDLVRTHADEDDPSPRRDRTDRRAGGAGVAGALQQDVRCEAAVLDRRRRHVERVRAQLRGHGQPLRVHVRDEHRLGE